MLYGSHRGGLCTENVNNECKPIPCKRHKGQPWRTTTIKMQEKFGRLPLFY